MKECKKYAILLLKIFLAIICIAVIEFCFALFFGRPIIAVKDGDNYKGIFFDVYNCGEYSMHQIKSKGTKFSCIIDTNDYTKYKIVGDVRINCNEDIELYLDGERKIYTSCIDKLFVVLEDNKKVELNKFIGNDISILDKLLDNYEGEPFNDGGSVVYEFDNMRIFQCHYLGGNHNIYIGNETLINMCR